MTNEEVWCECLSLAKFQGLHLLAKVELLMQKLNRTDFDENVCVSALL
jgi:hypothetical protein